MKTTQNSPIPAIMNVLENNSELTTTEKKRCYLEIKHFLNQHVGDEKCDNLLTEIHKAFFDEPL